MAVVPLLALAVLAMFAGVVHGVPSALVSTRAQVTSYPAIYATIVYSGHTAFEAEGITVKTLDGAIVLNSTSVATNSSAATVEAHLSEFTGGTVLLNVAAGSVTPALAADVLLEFTYQQCPAFTTLSSGWCFRALPSSGDTWESSGPACESAGAALASIHRDAENNAVAELCGEGCWLAVSDTSNSGEYKNTDGSAVDYTDWGSGQPNTANGRCVYLDGGAQPPGLWATATCNEAFSHKPLCKSPNPVCSNGKQDGWPHFEEGVDCGGPCEPCVCSTGSSVHSNGICYDRPTGELVTHESAETSCPFPVSEIGTAACQRENDFLVTSAVCPKDCWLRVSTEGGDPGWMNSRYEGLPYHNFEFPTGAQPGTPACGFMTPDGKWHGTEACEDNKEFFCQKNIDTCRNGKVDAMSPWLEEGVDCGGVCPPCGLEASFTPLAPVTSVGGVWVTHYPSINASITFNLDACFVSVGSVWMEGMLSGAPGFTFAMAEVVPMRSYTYTVTAPPTAAAWVNLTLQKSMTSGRMYPPLPSDVFLNIYYEPLLASITVQDIESTEVFVPEVTLLVVFTLAPTSTIKADLLTVTTAKSARVVSVTVLKLMPWRYQFTVNLDPAEGGDVTVTIPTHVGSVATTTPALQAAASTPTLQFIPEVLPTGAVWDASLAFFTIRMLSPVNFGLDRRVGNCAETLMPSSLGVLGTAPVCAWVSGTDVRVYPGNDATLTLRGGVDMNTALNLTDSDGQVFTLVSGSVEGISPPPGEPTPVIAALNAQESVGPCTNLTLDASTSESPSGRPLTFQWNVTGDSANPPPSALIDFLTSQPTSQQVVVIPRSLLPNDATFNFTVMVSDFVPRSDQATVTVHASTLPTPTATLLTPATLSVFRAHETTLRVSGSAATSCDGVVIVSYSVAYKWTQTVGPALGLSASSQDPRVLVIPKNRLTVGSVYAWKCEVSMVTAPDRVTSVAVAITTVKSSALVPVLKSLASESSITTAITLDGGASYDPDAIALAATWRWKCTMANGLPCRWANGSTVSLAQAPVVTIPASSLASSLVGTTVTFSLTYTVGTRTAGGTITTTLLAAPPVVSASVTLLDEDGNLVTGKANPSSALVARATASILARRRLEELKRAAWGSSGEAAVAGHQHGRALVSLEQDDFLRYSWSSPTVPLTTPGLLATSITDRYLVINPGFLTPGATYRFRLTASAVNAQEAVLASSTAAVVVKVNTAPRPGTFVVSPNTGIELNTKFTLLAEGWTDEPEDYPLKYRYGVAIGRRSTGQIVWYDDTSDNAAATSDYVPLSPAVLATRYTTQLPAGDKTARVATVRVVVSDAYRASTQMAYWVNVSRPVVVATRAEATARVNALKPDIDNSLDEGNVEQAVVIVSALTDTINEVDTIAATENVATLPCYGTNDGVEENEARTTLIQALVSTSNAASLDDTSATQQLLLGARLTAAPGQITESSADSALEVSKRATTQLPATELFTGVAAQAATVAMSNIATARDRLLRASEPITDTNPLPSLSGAVESCACTVNPAGVRSCTCPSSSPAEAEAAKAWLEIVEVMKQVSARRLAPRAPNEGPSSLSSCRIDMKSYRRTLNTLSSTSVVIDSTKAPGNLVANVRLPNLVEAGRVALGLPANTDPNDVRVDFRVVRWVDDPLSFADQGKAAVVASQVLTVDFVDSSGNVAHLTDLPQPVQLRIPWQSGQQLGIDMFNETETSPRSLTCSAADVTAKFTQFSECTGLPFTFGHECTSNGETVAFKCPITTAIPTCTYWKDDAAGNSTWNSTGCTLKYATVTHIVCECTHFTDFGAAYVQLLSRSSDVLGVTPDITLSQVAENIPLLIVIGVMLFASIGMVVLAHKLDKVDPPPLLLPSSKNPALNRTTLYKLSAIGSRRGSLLHHRRRSSATSGFTSGLKLASDGAQAGAGASGPGKGPPPVIVAIDASGNTLAPSGAVEAEGKAVELGSTTAIAVTAGESAVEQPDAAMDARTADGNGNGVAVIHHRAASVASAHTSMVLVGDDDEEEPEPVEKHSWGKYLRGQWGVFVDLMKHRHPWLALSSRKGTLGRVERVLLLVLAVFVSFFVLALQYNTEVDAEERSSSFQVTVATILINGFVAACINLPVQKGIAFLMLRLGAEREPVRRLTTPEKLLQEAAQDAWAQQAGCCARGPRCCRPRSEATAVTSLQPAARAEGMAGVDEMPRDVEPTVLAKDALTTELQQLNCVRKGMYKALIPPSVKENNRPRRPGMWACIAYSAVSIIVLFCAFFVMMFGFRFGGAVAGAFLWSFLASLCFGGFVVQPLAILGFSWMKYTLFASFIVHVIPGFHASDHYHLERVVMNDGPATALAAVLLANSTSTLPEDAVEVWDDDSGNAKKASSKDRKPAPGVSFVVAGAQKSSSGDDDAAAPDGEADVDAGTSTSATGGMGAGAGAGAGAGPVSLAQGSGFGSMGVVGGRVGASMGDAAAEAEGDDQSVPEPSGVVDLDVAVRVQDGGHRVAVPPPAVSSSFGSADASAKMITTPNSQVGEAQELTLARTRGSTPSMRRAAPGPVASASGVRLVTVGSAVSESAWQDLAPNAARAAGAGAGADQSDSERHL